jgi:hypothetical protein
MPRPQLGRVLPYRRVGLLSTATVVTSTVVRIPINKIGFTVPTSAETRTSIATEPLTAKTESAGNLRTFTTQVAFENSLRASLFLVLINKEVRLRGFVPFLIWNPIYVECVRHLQIVT